MEPPPRAAEIAGNEPPAGESHVSSRTYESASQRFDAYVEKREKKSPTFAKELKKARREIEQVDAIVRALDEARVDVGMSKAELARAIGARPDALRRLFTAEASNPTLQTVARLCDALGFRLTVEPKEDRGGEATA